METALPTVSARVQAADLQEIFEAQRAHQAHVRQTTARQRIRKLKLLRGVIAGIRPDLQAAIYQDFGKPPTETDLTEIFPSLKAIDYTIKHLSDWMKPRKAETPFALMGSDSQVVFEPKGTALIIAPWNYPFYLMMDPLVSAIAAGNTAILKPSEMTPHTSDLIRRLITELFPADEVAVVEGDKEVAQALLRLPFDHIFFTGSTAVGKKVMAAAAENLASVTLELGGKSPAIVDETADLTDAAQKIVYGKCINAGQTCIAPDYLLVHESVQAALVDEIKRVLHRFYGDITEQNIPADMARIVNDHHFGRLSGLLHEAVERGAHVLTGGWMLAADRFVPPTLLTDVTPDMAVMQEEIFGPILPVIPFRELSEAVAYTKQFSKPLAAYFFTRRPFNAQYLLDHTTAGGTCINETVLHVGNPALPFGGVNHSGIGKAHGYYGFLAFSNERAVLRQRVGLTSVKLMYPPYNAIVRATIDRLVRLF